MDNIKFVVEEIYELEGSEFKSYEVAVYLNDKKLPHSIFNASEVLPIYKYHFVEFDLFTCSCGVAGCAGFQSPVTQTIQNEVVTWKFPEENDYTTDKKVYEFSKVEYQKEFEKLIAHMVALEKENIIHNTLVRDEAMYGYNEEEDSDRPRYEVSTTLKESMKWYEGRYQGEQNFNDMLKQTFPELMDKKFQYTYNGVEGRYSHDLGSVVCRLLNQYPRKAKETAFLNKSKVAVKAIVDLSNGNNKGVKKLANNSYEKHGMSSDSLVSWDFPEMSKDDFVFDFEKVGLKIQN